MSGVRPLLGPNSEELPFRVYSDGRGEQGGGPDGLWQYAAESLEDAVDCAEGLFFDGPYRAVYVKEQGVEVFRLGGGHPGRRARPSSLAAPAVGTGRTSGGTR